MLNKKSISAIAAVNLASTFLGLAYSVVLARYFGVGTGIEVYFAATTLLFMLNSLTQSGQLAEIALPIYHKFQTAEGQQAANKVMSVILNWMAVLAVFFVGLSFLLAKPLFFYSASGFTPEQLEEGTFLFRIISPLLFIEILKSQIAAIVNAEKKFGRIEWINILNQVVSMIFIFLLSGKIQIYSVVAGLWVGEIVAFLYGISILRKTNFEYFLIFRYPKFSLREMWKNMSYTFLYVIVAQSYLYYLNNLVTHLPRGQYAIYKYALLIFTKLQGLLLRPVSTVFFSQFSTLYHEGSARLRHLLNETNSLSFILSTTIFSGIVALGHPMLSLLWEGDKFDAEHIQWVYWALVVNSICLFFNALAIIYRKISMTLGLVKPMYLGFIATQILSILLLYSYGGSVDFIKVYGTILLNTAVLTSVPILVSVLQHEKGIHFGIGENRVGNILYLVFAVAGAVLFEWYSTTLTANWSPIMVLLMRGVGLLSWLLILVFVFRLQERNLFTQLLRKLKR